MKKIVRILSSFIIVLLVSGCFDLKVETGVKSNYTAYLNYDIKIDLTNVDSSLKESIKNYVSEIGEAYQELGFRVQDKSSLEKIDFVLKYEQTAKSYEEGITNLKGILSNPQYSIFLTTDITSSTTKTQQALNFKANTNLKKILDTSSYSQLPLNIVDKINNGLKDGKATLILGLPKSNVIEANTKNIKHSDMTYLEYDVSLNDNSEFILKSTASLKDNQVISGDTNSLISQFNNEIMIYKVMILVGIILIIGCVVLIIRLKKKEKTNKEKTHENNDIEDNNQNNVQ